MVGGPSHATVVEGVRAAANGARTAADSARAVDDDVRADDGMVTPAFSDSASDLHNNDWPADGDHAGSAKEEPRRATASARAWLSHRQSQPLGVMTCCFRCI